jgi:uncharacterized membrane protein
MKNSPPEIVRSRVSAVDIVRGAAIVFMALDHVRDFVTVLRFQPENLARGSAGLFFTRWVTHFCAPAFFLLAGVGIGISQFRGTPAGALSRYLLLRGLWLLVLELVITPVGWQFGFDLIPAFALVLWALGWSMILMAGFIHLPRGLTAAIAVVMIAGHNLLDPIQPPSLGRFAGLWTVVHVPGFAIPSVLFVGYPLVPWVAVMMLGYVLASVYQWNDARRRRLFIGVGCAAVVGFVVLRYVNGYGNGMPWNPQRTPALTVASFLNLRKYPPSLQFLLMTLGPTLIVLALAERARGVLARFLSVYGRVPLFFYVTHIFVGHVFAVLLAYVQGGEWRRIPIVHAPESIPGWYGVGLPGVYLAWISVVLLLYYPCRQFARLKDTRTDWWLRYL